MFILVPANEMLHLLRISVPYIHPRPDSRKLAEEFRLRYSVTNPILLKKRRFSLADTRFYVTKSSWIWLQSRCKITAQMFSLYFDM